ncbi:hypothetical protein ACINWC743_1558 [Acinetobacter sp. WC-743]|uniref:hypothetical protein n=1 Tax=Acinetobacter sp. WC-743 TaxID=903945 RepID=UPI0002AECFD6|nr:hypothetical protein [Acinetobacter sp. WC-743]ELW82060.1 hypothetical protein ACINWC743_1558 [Acinetobacter sp. WC-743]
MVKPFNEYIDELHKNGSLDDYALRTGTTNKYLFIQLKHRRRIPNKTFMQALAKESNGTFSYEELVLWFYELKTA